MKMVALSGSLRSGSYNTALLNDVRKRFSDQIDVRIYSIHDIPLYNGDIENLEGLPAIVVEIKQALISCDALLIATPEYNHSIPGVLKNAIDWLSRPPKDIKHVFNGLPVAVMGASTGGFGTMLAQQAWLPIFHVLGMKPWFGDSLCISHAYNVFDELGEIENPQVISQLRKFIQGFINFVQADNIRLESEKQEIMHEQVETFL